MRTEEMNVRPQLDRLSDEEYPGLLKSSLVADEKMASLAM